MKFNCDFCNKEFDKPPAMVNRNITKCCSVKCRKELIKSERVEKNCEYCQKKFKLKPSKEYLKCCSRQCSLKYREENPKGKPVISSNKLLCVRCEQYKDFEDFYDTGHTTPNNIRRNKMTNCKECHILIGKEQRHKRIKTIEGTLKELLKRSRNCKKGKEEVCNLDLEYLLSLYDNQQGKCALSGVELETATFYNLKGVSIDRINSDIGYIKGNVQLVCWVVNQMKNDLSNEELIKWSNYITKYNEDKGQQVDSKSNLVY